MIDLELVDLRKLDAVFRAAAQDVLPQFLMHQAFVRRQVHDLGFVPERAFGDRPRRHRERGQVIEKEIVQMVVGDRDDCVGRRLGEAFPQNTEGFLKLRHIFFVGVVAVPEDPGIVGRCDNADGFRHNALLQPLFSRGP